MAKQETFECEMCKGTFDLGSEEEAEKEYKKNFGELPPELYEDRAIVCDDCHKEFMKSFH